MDQPGTQQSKAEGLFLTKDWADGRGKSHDCKQPQALSTSAVLTDLKRRTLPIQSVGKTPVQWDYCHYIAVSKCSDKQNQQDIVGDIIRGEPGWPGLPSCNGDLIGRVLTEC